MLLAAAALAVATAADAVTSNVLLGLTAVLAIGQALAAPRPGRPQRQRVPVKFGRPIRKRDLAMTCSVGMGVPFL